MCIYFPAIINLPELYSDFNANTDKALPVALNYNHHGKDVQNTITKNIREFYFNNGKLSKETHQNLTNVSICPYYTNDGEFIVLL